MDLGDHVHICPFCSPGYPYGTAGFGYAASQAFGGSVLGLMNIVDVELEDLCTDLLETLDEELYHEARSW